MKSKFSNKKISSRSSDDVRGKHGVEKKSNESIGNRQNKIHGQQLKLLQKQRLVAGSHAISEVLKVRPESIVEAFIVQGWQAVHQQSDFVSRFKAKNIKITEKPKGFFDQVYPNHQGSLLVVEGRPEFEIVNLKSASQVIFLDGIEDPHNLGAIVRTAWLMGVQGIFVLADRAVDLTPTVHKVACGGVEHVPVVKEVNFKNRIEELKELGFWFYGLSHQGKMDIFDCKLPSKIAWCIGAEDKGLRGTTEKFCDELVRIPQVAAEASYNASVATAVALSEGYRQIQKMKSHG